MGSLPIGYAERAWRLEDAEAIAAMINAYSKTVWGREEVGAESLRAQMQTPGVTLATDTRLVLGPGGGIAAVGFAIDLAEPHVLVQSSGYVRHKDQSRGIGGWLADWIETRAREAIDRAPAGARVAVMQSVDDRDARAKELLEARGYQVVRHFWRMAIELSHSVPAAQWPDGIRVAALDSGIDLRRAYAAGREAFKDHWGHVESSEEEGFERFMYRLENDPDIDRSLRFVALDGDEIAAVCYANPRDGVDERAGYIELLGVRPAWRKRGLALGLLRHTFAALRERGRIGCSLHVDSESLTGATRVYEKAGMHVSELNHAYELELRPGKDLVKRTASS